MKIISGKYKGRNIEGFTIDGTRPTMDRVKESLFAMIQNYIPNSNILDLFSGSGNLAFESLSEGASSAVLVDSNYKAIKVINNNIKTIGIENTKVLNMDYKKAIEILKDEKFDVIFLDPPYKTNYIEESIKLISKYNILSESGIIVCESDSLDKIIYSDEYKCIKDKKYGDKYIVILKKMC
ncbi:MAG: 16S rRNA (guanine(966)-N(2))-methyltransferase RsmD [Bacilli bacterium]|nr:16S rRNA (guanine(966)-N(2))-methyltransferase RsmD [Bacilli bacterium]